MKNSKLQVRNVRVQILRDDGASFFGTLNIWGFDRTSDFFDYKFRNGGNIQLVNVDDGDKNLINKKMNKGFNAARILEWSPVNESELKGKRKNK